MEDLNVSHITLSGYVQLQQYRYLYFSVIFLVYVFITYSNSVIVYTICIHQSLHEPMYIFIAVLLINSLLFSAVIYPKLLIDVLSETQTISYSACRLQAFFYYSLGGSDFLLLAVMAYDRYVSICRPLQYPNIMKTSTVVTLLAVAWLVPACELLLSLTSTANKKLCRFSLRVIFCNNSVAKLYCVQSRAQSVYGVFILVNVVFVPLLFIVFTYLKIFQITSGKSREVRRKAAETCLPHLLVLINFSLLCTYDVFTLRLESDIPHVAHFLMSLQVVLYHPLFNPIIYGLKMKEISKHLKQQFFWKTQ